MPLEVSTPPAPDYGQSAILNIVLSQPEAARLMRLSTRTLERLAENGEAPPRIQSTGRRVGYWRSDVIAWLQARTSPAKRAA